MQMTQLYVPLHLIDRSFSNISKCLEDVKGWMAKNFLQLNERKTNVVVLGSLSSSPRIEKLLRLY